MILANIANPAGGSSFRNGLLEDWATNLHGDLQALIQDLSLRACRAIDQREPLS